MAVAALPAQNSPAKVPLLTATQILEVQCLCGGLLLKLGALDAKVTSQVRVIGSDGQAVVQSCLQSLYGLLQSDEVSEAFNSAISVQCKNKLKTKSDISFVCHTDDAD